MNESFPAPALPTQEPPARAVAARRFSRLAFLPVLLVCAAAVALSLLRPTNVDVSWLVSVADRVIGGEHLYSDIIEVNPPVSVWLYAPFVLLERLTGIAAEIWLSFAVPILAAASVWFSAGILLRSGETLRHPAWMMTAAAAAVLLMFPSDFAQREQFAVIALLPWLALLAARDATPDFRAGSVGEHIVAGLGASVLIAMKAPYSVLAVALPVLALALSRRSVRPLFTAENLIAGVFSLAYALVFLTVYGSFFDNVLPLARQLYLPTRMPVAEMLTVWPVTLLAGMAIAVLAMSWAAPLHSGAKVCLLAALGYLPAFVIMGKSWTYQALPFLVLGTLAMLLQAGRLGGAAKMPAIAKAGAALAFFLAAKLAVSMYLLPADIPATNLAAAADVIARTSLRPTILSLAMRLQPASPLTRVVGGRFVGRYPSGWMLENATVLINAGVDPAQRQVLEALRQTHIAAFAAEIASKRPDIVLDDGTSYSGPATSLLREPAIRQAMADYRLLYRDASFTLFVRSATADEASR